jgi:hypothetical protein
MSAIEYNIQHNTFWSHETIIFFTNKNTSLILTIHCISAVDIYYL